MSLYVFYYPDDPTDTFPLTYMTPTRMVGTGSLPLPKRNFAERIPWIRYRGRGRGNGTRACEFLHEREASIPFGNRHFAASIWIVCAFQEGELPRQALRFTVLTNPSSSPHRGTQTILILLSRRHFWTADLGPLGFRNLHLLSLDLGGLLQDFKLDVTYLPFGHSHSQVSQGSNDLLRAGLHSEAG